MLKVRVSSGLAPTRASPPPPRHEALLHFEQVGDADAVGGLHTGQLQNHPVDRSKSGKRRSLGNRLTTFAVEVPSRLNDEDPGAELASDGE